jgi:hypothetical protein
MTHYGIERATFRLVAQCLNQLRYRVILWLQCQHIINENLICFTFIVFEYLPFAQVV